MAEMVLEDTGKITRTGFSDLELTLSLVSTDAGDFRLVLDPRVTGGLGSPTDQAVIDIPFESAAIDVPSADIVSSIAQYQSADLPDFFPQITSAATTAVDGFTVPVGETWRNVDVEGGDEQTKNLGVSKPTVPVFTVNGNVPDGVSLPFDIESLPTTVEEATGLDSIGVPDVETRYWEFRSAIPFTSEAEFSFGNISVDDLFEVEEVEIDFSEIDIEVPLLVTDSLPTIEPSTDELSATVTQQLRNDGNAPAEASFDLTISPAWKSTSTTTSGSVGPVSPGGVGNLNVVVDSGVPNFGDISFTEAAQAAKNGNTGVTFEWEYSGDVPDGAEWTSGSETVDFTDALEPIADDVPEPLLSIDNIIPSQLSLPTSGELPTPFEVVVENNGDATAEGVTISGFGDTQTITVPQRGSKSVQLSPSPSVLPGVGGEIEQDIDVEFDGQTVASEAAEIIQADFDGPQFDFADVPDLSLDPDESLGQQIFEITNNGDQPAAVDLVVGDASVGLGSVSPGSTTPAEINLDSISLPEPGSTSDFTAQIVDQASGEIYAQRDIPITLGVDIPDVAEEVEGVLDPSNLQLPNTVISGGRGELQWTDVDPTTGEIAVSVPSEPSGKNATAKVDVPGSGQVGVGPFADDIAESSARVGEPIYASVDAGDKFWLFVQYGDTGEFTIPPNNSSQGTWTVPPIAGVTAFPSFNLGEPSISSNLYPGSPFEISAVVGSNWIEPAEAEIGIIINGQEVYTTNKTIWPPGTSGSSKPISFDFVPQLGSGVLSNLSVEDRLSVRIEVRNTPSAPDSVAGVVDSYEAERFIRPPVSPNFSLSVPDGLSFDPEEPLSFPLTVSNSGEGVGQLDISVTQDGEDVFSDTIEVGPNSTEEITIEDDLSPGVGTQYTISTNIDSIEDKTVGVDVEALPKPNIDFSVPDSPTLGIGDPLTLPVEVTNSGDEAKDVPVSVTPDGGSESTKNITVPPGATETVEFTPTPPSPNESLGYTINVAGEEQNITATMEELAPANFSLETPDSVTMDEPSVVEVEAVVENTGQEAGSTEVSMLDAFEVVELDGGESTTVPLRTDITPSPGDVQDYTVELSDGTSDTVGVEFPTDLADTARPTAEIDVQNTGDVPGSMTLLLGGNIVGSREVDAGETTTFTIEPPLPDPGTESLYEVRVRPDDDNVSGDTEQFNMATDVLPEPEPPSFDLVDVVAPDEARVGQSITVDAIVANTGGESGEVTVRSDGDIRQVTIDGGSQEIVTLSLPSPFNQGFEQYEVSVGGQSETFDVDFRDVEPDVPDAPELPETPQPPQPPQQPGLPQPPGQTPGVPTPPGDGEQPYDGVFTYLDPLGVLGTSEQISLDLFGDD